MNTLGHASGWRRCLRHVGAGFAWLLLASMTLWAAAALYFDLSWPQVRPLTPTVYLVVIAAAAYPLKPRLLKMSVCLAGFLIVLTCWLSLKPSNDRPWQSSDSQTPFAEINGDRV